jgi:tRNA (adenine57-N1/adenine58-N1)-methyltransferase catalytic subunit
VTTGARPFVAGERIMLVDSKGRRYLITLKAGGEWHSHHGAVSHDDLIDTVEGTAIASSGGSKMLAFRPTMADFVLKMQRGAQVVYPKDIGLILVYADIFPGARVVEAGTGSGSLTLALLRAVGSEGRVISYESREDHLERAKANIESWFESLGAKPDNLELRSGDVFSHPPDEPMDRLVLDLPEPWHALGTVAGSLVSGGVMCAYVPTVPQVSQTVAAMRGGGFAFVTAFEGLLRSWNVEGQSVRPDHRMVGHTGFLVTGRKLDPSNDHYPSSGSGTL